MRLRIFPLPIWPKDLILPEETMKTLDKCTKKKKKEPKTLKKEPKQAEPGDEPILGKQ